MMPGPSEAEWQLIQEIAQTVYISLNDRPERVRRLSFLQISVRLTAEGQQQ